jgi:cephalosporin hydroxylase
MYLKYNTSIIIPSLDFSSLERCLYFINKHSYYKHEVLVHLNYCNKEKFEEIKAWKFSNIDNFHVQYSSKNLGISIPVNNLVKKASNDYILYLNDDEFLFKDWDLELYNFIGNDVGIETKMFTLRRIEPPIKNMRNIKYSGLSVRIENSELEEELYNIDKYKELSNSDINIRKSVVPFFMNKKTFQIIGGYDEKYYPGNGSDPDLGYNFIKRYGIDSLNIVSNSLVYHNSERRGSSNIPLIKAKANEYEIFRNKFGIHMEQFDEMLWDFSKISNNLSVEYIIDLAFHFFSLVQNKEEILWLANKIKKELKPKNILEIGVERGGTSFIWNLLSDIGIRIGINYKDFVANEHRDKVFKHMKISNIQFMEENSQSKDTFIKIKNKLDSELIDLLFIDADHSYLGVKKDFELYRTLVRKGGWIVFHDIVESEFNKQTNCEVYKLWAELLDDKKEECIIEKEKFGIGIFRNE